MLSDRQALEMNVLVLLHNFFKTEAEEVNEKELASWIQENVYKEVPSECQKSVSTCLVISPG